MDRLKRMREGEEPIMNRGTFYCAYKSELVLGLLLGAIALTVAYSVLVTYDDVVRKAFKLAIYTLDILLGAVFTFLNMGRECEYEAGATEFIVRGPGKKREIFYYRDIQDITYRPWNRIGRAGIIVTIETGVRKIEYRCIFSDNKVLTGFSGTPFYYLAKNSGFQVEEDTFPTDPDYFFRHRRIGDDDTDSFD